MIQPSIVTVHAGTLPLQCCTYAIVGPTGAVLVDPGSGYYENEVVEGLRAHGLAPEDVSVVLLTHYHVDHARGAGSWRARGARLLGSAGTAEALVNASPTIWSEHPELLSAVEVDEVIVDGQVLDIAGIRIECLATPGHTRACMSYIVAAVDGLSAFTGDVLMYDCQPGWAGGHDFSQESLLDSLAKLQALGLKHAYPGHDAIEGDVSAWLAAGEQLGRTGQWRLTR